MWLSHIGAQSGNICDATRSNRGAWSGSDLCTYSAQPQLPNLPGEQGVPSGHLILLAAPFSVRLQGALRPLFSAQCQEGNWLREMQRWVERSGCAGVGGWVSVGFSTALPLEGGPPISQILDWGGHFLQPPITK